MKSVKDKEFLGLEVRLLILKEAKGATWYDSWRPFCMMCDSAIRMRQENFGFHCRSCGNMIGWDLTRLKESPLNEKKR